MKKNISTLLLFILIGCSNLLASPKQPNVKASAHFFKVPILRGLPSNVVMRIDVIVPEGSGKKEYQTLRCRVKAEKLSDIKKIDVYLTPSECFSTTYRKASFTPTATDVEIPLSLILDEGKWYIWCSIVLTDNASIDGKIQLTCTDLLLANGKPLAIQQEETYANRLGVAIRKIGDDEVNTYRIPGIAQTKAGTLIAVYDARYENDRDLPGNIDVGMSRSTDNGNTWESMKIIIDMGQPHKNNGVGDPAVLVDSETGKIFVAAMWTKDNRGIIGSIGGLSPDSTGQLVMVSSVDDGLTWSAAHSITPQVKIPEWKLFFNGPGRGITMQNGTLVFAAQYWDKNNIPFSTLIYSQDHGNTWKGKIAGAKSNTTESQLVEITDGTLMISMRDNRGRFRSVATTDNLGNTWVEHATSYNTLPDPVCMASLIKARVQINGTSKETLFFSNPSASAIRHNTTVKASADLGKTWAKANQLLIDERVGYGYSCLTKIDDATLGLLYEGNRELYFVKIPVSEIIH